MARRQTAGVYDIRNVIGGLIGLYGVILTVMGILDAGDNGTGDASANLWAGLAMLAFGVVFIAWARLRPVVVEDEPEAARQDPAG
ncbi:hypothetical protein [Nocardioides pyridinolyticus]